MKLTLTFLAFFLGLTPSLVNANAQMKKRRSCFTSRRYSTALGAALTFILFCGLWLAETKSYNISANASEDFHIVITRQTVKDGLVIGTISVNDQVIGNAYENEDLKIQAGSYRGVLRYWSGHNFVQGPFGTIGKEGDFLLEVTNVHQADGRERKDILFHGGNKPQHSKGCILLGPVGKDPSSGIPSLDDSHPLRKLRKLFYGTDMPNSTPNKNIIIDVG